ncbi:MAG: glycosyltransferase, partial [Ignavibacteriae bacterium]|nr:glycosyltransferase [Ignavibacteriota bacterium]
LEIILVNDSSTDRTAEIIERYRQSRSFLALHAKPGEGNLRGKTNAITQGIEVSRGEILMFTDADCTVQPGWVRETVQYFDEETAIVGGFTLLKADRTFEGIQALDWVFLFNLASATAGWNIPLTAIGNNLSVRRSAYDKTGGYKEIAFSVTEDYSLVQSIRRKTKLKVRFPANSHTVVTSNACKTWKQLFRQKQRWGVGGLDMVFHGLLIMAIGWMFRIALIAGVYAASFPVLGVALVSMAVGDGRFIGKVLREFTVSKYFKYFIAFEVYFTFYILLIPFVAFASRKVVWKERTL